MIANELPKSLQDNPWLDQWIRIAKPGEVEVASGKVEIGQGIATAMAQIAAEELEVDIGRVQMVSGDTDASPDEGYTAGSMSVEIGGRSLQIAAATMRQAMLNAAAARLGVAPAELSVDDGAILVEGAPSGLDYWTLADAASERIRITGSAPLKRAAERRLIGVSVPRIDLERKILGGSYVHDLVLPGMVHARVLHRTPAMSPERVAERSGGTIRVVRVADFVALVGADEAGVASAAERAMGAEALDIPLVDRPDWFEAAPAVISETRTGTAPGTVAGATTFSARYSRPFIAHASIGPSCAVATFSEGKLTVWSHSQGVFFLRQQIAKLLSLPLDDVRVIHTPGAGCYGHNPADDVAFDAALIARELPETPVRVLWTRGDELAACPIGSAMIIDLAADLDASGRIADWRTTIRSATHAGRPGTGGLPNLLGGVEAGLADPPPATEDVPDVAGAGARRNAALLYDLPGQTITFHLLHKLPRAARTSSLRGLGAFANVFAIESFMDELAEAAGADPVAFRLAHLSDPRARTVIETVAEMAGWGPAAETGLGRAKGIGFAKYKNKAAYCAVILEVAVEETVQVERVWCAVDAGLVVNPDGTINQVDGGIVQSLSWALHEAVGFDGERIGSSTWDTYPIMRFSGVPEIETRIVTPPEGAGPLGVGETSHGPTAGALGNAVARALGVRVRDLPLTRDRIIAAIS